MVFITETEALTTTEDFSKVRKYLILSLQKDFQYVISFFMGKG